MDYGNGIEPYMACDVVHKCKVCDDTGIVVDFWGYARRCTRCDAFMHLLSQQQVPPDIATQCR